MKKNLFLLASCSLLLFACSKEESTTTTTNTETCGTYTYDADVKAIIDAKCSNASCHGGGQTPLLNDYAAVNAQKDRVKARAVTAKTMPPASATQLTSDELKKLECWLNDGAKEK